MPLRFLVVLAADHRKGTFHCLLGMEGHAIIFEYGAQPSPIKRSH